MEYTKIDDDTVEITVKQKISIEDVNIELEMLRGERDIINKRIDKLKVQKQEIKDQTGIEIL